MFTIQTYILFDLEAIGKNEMNDFMEIIEIAAQKVVKIKSLELENNNEFAKRSFKPQYMVIDTFHTYVNPVFHNKMSKKLKKLTNIDFEDLKNGKSFEQGINDFISWAGKDSTFVEWSKSDENMIYDNACKHYIQIPSLYFFDLQKEYDNFYLKNKRTSLGNAVHELGNNFTGKAHNALDDSKNMISIMTQII